MASALADLQATVGGSQVKHVEVIGDAHAPGLISVAVISGHLAARNFEADPQMIEAALFRREVPSLSAK